MEFEVGKLYERKDKGITVKCTNLTRCGLFEGVVVSINNDYLIGYKAHWPEREFEEYSLNQINGGYISGKEHLKGNFVGTLTLQNGHKYNIPKGCKATITDDVIEIEEDIRYLKWTNGKKSKYFRVSSDKCLVVSKNENQPNVIWSLDSYATYNSNEVVNSTKEEFEEAYKEAMEMLKL